MTQAGMLACPRCGAAVSERCAQCTHCAAPLLVKACPSCLARVFEGHRFCPECGGGLAVVAGARATRSCPRCAITLEARVLGDLTLDDCGGCGGTFVDRAALELLLGERRGARADSVLGAYEPPPDEVSLAPPGGPFYVKCPDCRTVMNRKMFAYRAKVVVDVCRPHGTWFDRHELPRILRFVASGGLARAEQRQLEDAREQLRKERTALRIAMEHAPPPVTSRSASFDAGNLADLLSALLG